MSTYPAAGLHVDIFGMPSPALQMGCKDSHWAELAGNPSVLNNGDANTLLISITNNSMAGKVAFTTESPIYLLFVVTPEQANANSFMRPWALCTQEQLNEKGVTLSFPKYPIELKNSGGGIVQSKYATCFQDPKLGFISAGGDTALSNSLSGWKLTPNQPFNLQTGESIIIQLDNIRTNLPAGPSQGYCKVELLVDDNKNNFSTTFGPVQKSGTVLRKNQPPQGGKTLAETLTVAGNINIKGFAKEDEGHLSMDHGNIKISHGNVLVGKGDVELAEGNLSVRNGDLTIIQTAEGEKAPHLNIINNKGKVGETVDINLSGCALSYDPGNGSNKPTPPASRISSMLATGGSADLIFSNKNLQIEENGTVHNFEAEPVERLRIKSDGKITVGGQPPIKVKFYENVGQGIPTNTDFTNKEYIAFVGGHFSSSSDKYMPPIGIICVENKNIALWQIFIPKANPNQQNSPYNELRYNVLVVAIHRNLVETIGTLPE